MLIYPSRRIAHTPYVGQIPVDNAKGYTVYNHTLLPVVFESIEADYHHLKQHVQLWDVSCQRQVEVKGPDAGYLVQLLTPRTIQNMTVGQCFYIPVVDQNGGLLNDPVLIKLADNQFWISLSDSDLLLWIQGLAIGKNLNVEVTEPPIFPLAVQGPKSDELMTRVFGDRVKSLSFFHFSLFPFGEQSFVIARSGFSKQGGYEIYVEGRDHCLPLRNTLLNAGQDLNVRLGCPNLIERIESGLLSYGNDMTREDTPFDCGLGKFYDEEGIRLCLGGAALTKRQQTDPPKTICGLQIETNQLPPCVQPFPITVNQKSIGQLTSATWSPDLKTHIGIAMIFQSYFKEGATVTIHYPDKTEASAKICSLPFI